MAPHSRASLDPSRTTPKLMIDQLAGNDEIVRQCFSSPDIQEIVYTGLARGIYESVMAQQQKPL